MSTTCAREAIGGVAVQVSMTRQDGGRRRGGFLDRLGMTAMERGSGVAGRLTIAAMGEWQR